MVVSASLWRDLFKNGVMQRCTAQCFQPSSILAVCAYAARHSLSLLQEWDTEFTCQDILNRLGALNVFGMKMGCLHASEYALRISL